MIIHCIYKTTNLINNKTYVGQFNDDEKDWKRYLGSGNNIKHAIKKYGRKNFKKEIIVQGDFNEALMDSLEIHYIQLYSPPESPLSYNIARGGGNGKLGVPDPNRKRIFQYDLQGNFIKEWSSSQEIEKNLGLNARSIRHCASGKKMLTNKGFIWLFDENINDRIAKINPTSRKYSKDKIYQFDFDNNLVSIWNSISEIVKNTNFKAANLSAALRKEGLSAYGFIWTTDSSPEKRLIKIQPVKQRIKRYSFNETIYVYYENEWYTFGSVKDVSVFLKIDCKTIRKRLKNGYYWTRRSTLISTIMYEQLPLNLNGHNKRINQYDKDGNFIKSWKSIKEATLEHSINGSSLSRALTKGTPSAGFIWQYA